MYEYTAGLTVRLGPGPPRAAPLRGLVIGAVVDAAPITGGQLPPRLDDFSVISATVTTRDPAGGYGTALRACGSRAVIPSCRSSRPTSKLRRGSYGPARCGA